MRLHAQTAMIENGFVRIPEDAPWLAEYLHEMTVFPNGKHDDQVDSTAQFLEWQKTPAPHDGYIEWLRREHEKLHRKPVPVPPQTNYAKGSMERFQQQEESCAARGKGIEAMPDPGPGQRAEFAGKQSDSGRDPRLSAASGGFLHGGPAV